jgi:hypothetical protein
VPFNQARVQLACKTTVARAAHHCLVTAQAQPGRKPTAQHKLASFASYGTIVALAGRPGVDTPSAQQCTNRTTVGKPVRAVAVFLCQIATGADDGQRGVWTTLNRQQVGETIVALATGGDPMGLKSKRQKAKGKRQKVKGQRTEKNKKKQRGMCSNSPKPSSIVLQLCSK